jgi:hypothetical protein
MIDSTIKKLGEFIDYSIMPEHARVKLVAIRSKAEFESILEKYEGKKLNVDFDKLKSANDSNYTSLARISLSNIYSLSNNLFAIDQFEDDKANPYYICESLNDFKLIKKYLLIFRPEGDWSFEVWCSINEHFEIKKFLEREKENLKFVKEMSNDLQRIYLANDGKYVYVRYSEDNKILKESVWGQMFNQILKPYLKNGVADEDIIYWDIVIYESLEKLKLHNVDLRTL